MITEYALFEFEVLILLIFGRITQGTELQGHTGDVATETVSMTLVDVNGDEITEQAIQIGKLIRLKADILGEYNC